ncbi:MAG: C10 family peptidase [Muribaculaceae bacterium]|nr:C10 family peptidase [Muribaculaceae bacterium]
MRSFFTLTLTFILGICSLSARQIPVEEAKEVARNFLATKFLVSTRAKGMGSEYDLKRIENKTLKSIHAFNIGEKDGFILVSAIGDNPKVVAYSDKGFFDINNLPPQLKGIVENASGFKETQSGKATRASGQGILHKTAEWGQGAPYNNLTPNNAAAGCVATAMSIAMHYHQWPDYTRGGEMFDWYFPDFKMNFDDYTIDWKAMSDENDPKFNEEVAKLMKSAGIASHMLYGMNEFNESGAEVWAIGNRMIEIYAYDKDCQFIEKKSFNDSEWDNMLKQQLDEIGPVIYRGGSVTAHCFVIDGYDNEGFYHVNWGWDGQSNGYYALDFSDVGGMDFGEYQGMIINIKPDRERKEYSKAFLSNADVYSMEGYPSSLWNFSASDIDTGENVYFITPVVTLNRQIGYFKVAVVDENDNIVKLIGETPKMGATFHKSVDDAPFCAHPGMALFFNMAMPPLNPGERYQLVSQDAVIVDEEWGTLSPDAPSLDPADYKLVLGGMLNPSYFYAKNNTSIFSTANFHMDENLPFMEEQYGILDHEFSFDRLRYDAIAPNFFVPSSGVKMEVIAKDEEGKEVKPLYVENYREENCEKFKYDINISPYEPYYEVYFRYDPADPRRTEGVSSDVILEKEGLIFKTEGENCILIGYNPDALPEEIMIPAVVSKDGMDYKMTEIAREALMHAPLKSISIDGENIAKIGRMAFSGMKNLENLYIFNMEDNINEDWIVSTLLQSSLSNIYSDKFYSYSDLANLAGAHFIHENLDIDRANIERPDMNFYFSALPTDPNMIVTFDSFKTFNERISSINSSFNTLNVPGVGNINKKMLESSGLPITQMWEYAIDKENQLLAIFKVIDNVEIESVEINGTPVTLNEAGFYPVPSDALAKMNVKVNFTVNGNQKMQTLYTAGYNNVLNSEDLAGVDSIFNDANATFDVYNLQGVKVMKDAARNDLQTLPSDIYIIGRRKILVR